MIVRIHRDGAVIDDDAGERRRLREHFSRHHWIRLERFLDSRFLELISGRIDSTGFAEYRDGALALELRAQDVALVGLLNFVLNDSALFRVLEDVTGCSKISRFVGRLYRMSAGGGHFSDWHDDLGGGRLLAFSLDLSSDRFEGGVLRIRDAKSKRVLAEAPTNVCNDAIVFRVDEGLEHANAPLEAGTRTALAGWFCEGRTISALLAGRG